MMSVLMIFQCSSSTQAQNKKVRYPILVYGVPPDPITQNAERVVAEKWGVEFIAVAGCDIPNDKKDSVQQHNQQVYDLLAEQNGQDWQIQFYKEIEEEALREQKIMEIIDKDIAWQKRLAKEKNGDYFLYQFYPIHGTENYDVKVSNYEEWKSKNSRVIYFKLRVDKTHQKVKIISDKKELDFYYE